MTNGLNFYTKRHSAPGTTHRVGWACTEEDSFFVVFHQLWSWQTIIGFCILLL